MLSFMAFKHRKLFPTLSVTNQTINCLDFCDPLICTNCDRYPGSDFTVAPPPPPPPSAGEPFNYRNQSISPSVIIILSLLVSFFLIVSYYVIIVKHCSNCNGSRNRPPPSQSDGTDEEHLDENQGPVIDHPIWFITTVGLQQAIINSITICKYKKGEGLIEGTECSVCLSEFQEDETVRLLPKCSHAFHIQCIDTWLRSHTNCPLCRACIVSDTVSPPLGSVDQNSHNLGANEQTQMENYAGHGELGENQVRNGGVCENNRSGTEDEGELLQVNDEIMLKQGVNSNGNGVFRVLSNMADNHTKMDDEIQLLRRSISMDSSSSSAPTMCLDLENIYSVESESSSVHHNVDVQKSDTETVPRQEDSNSSMLKSIGSSSIEQTLHYSPVSIKRSFSSSGRPFLPRHNGCVNSILPL
ncbi:hypothetical protein L1049_025480 [Liquidambar formosana]|uniref:RING-type E3 ubiquitin transferase n=1 Tax=Liquidambar formosana TaxID=63359 RepID=A0AAP0R4M6_LIQFO